MIIYDKNLNELQQIYALDIDLLQVNHFPNIINLIIKDDNNFILSTSYGSIKFYTKKGSEFILKNENNDIKISSLCLNSIKKYCFLYVMILLLYSKRI